MIKRIESSLHLRVERRALPLEMALGKRSQPLSNICLSRGGDGGQLVQRSDEGLLWRHVKDDADD